MPAWPGGTVVQSGVMHGIVHAMAPGPVTAVCDSVKLAAAYLTPSHTSRSRISSVKQRAAYTRLGELEMRGGVSAQMGYTESTSCVRYSIADYKIPSLLQRKIQETLAFLKNRQY